MDELKNFMEAVAKDAQLADEGEKVVEKVFKSAFKLGKPMLQKALESIPLVGGFLADHVMAEVAKAERQIMKEVDGIDGNVDHPEL